MVKQYKEQYMIFDWVLIENTPFQIYSLTRKKIGYHRRKETISYCRLQDVKPCPLTPEILVLNGFKAIDECMGYARYYDQENDVTIDFSGVVCYILFRDRPKKMFYVHELQHYYDFLKIKKVFKIVGE